MPVKIIPLSDTKIRGAKPKEKDYKLSDGDGLYLLVTASGGKLWRLKYRFAGKEKLLAFGAYPAVSLADARQRRDDAKILLANGQDPGAVKKAIQEAEKAVVAAEQNTFKKVSLEWFEKRKTDWVGTHVVSVKMRLEKYILPALGNTPISGIKAADVHAMLLQIEARGITETAKRARVICSQVFRYAVAHGYAEQDPTTVLKPSELFRKVEIKHFAAITEPKDLAPLLRSIDNYHGTFVIKSALQLLPMFFVRSKTFREMEWIEIDFDAALWSIPAEKMKMKHPHIVPLPQQAIIILKELHQLTGTGQYVFAVRTGSRHMSGGSINAALRYMGYDKDVVTGHGFRTTARTILDEVLGYRVDWIEAQSAHAVKDPNGRAYNRTTYLEDRCKMMQAWADYLEGLKQGAKVIPLRKAA